MSRVKEIILLIPCLLLMGSISALAEESFREDWASWSQETRAEMLKKSKMHLWIVVFAALQGS